MAFEDQVDELYADTDVQRMLSLSATAAPLRICYPKEVNVSRFLAWLMDPGEGHGLGDQPLRSLLVRAGQTDRAQAFSQNDRRFLSPSSVYTHSFSSVVVSTEVDVGLKTKRLLDVLILDPAAGLYIAIENKFGAKEGADQTKDYHKGLNKLFPSYRGIHIYLDSNEAEPEDEAWLAVGYDWLAEFLKSSEQRESTAQHVCEALAQFRSVIEDEDEDSDDKYSVMSYVEFSDVKPDRREALLSFANEVRAQNCLRAGREDNGWLALKRVQGLSASSATEEALEQMLALKLGLDRIR